MSSSVGSASRASPADSSRAVVGRSTRPTSVETDASHPATGAPVRSGSTRRRLLEELQKNSKPIEPARLLRVSPYGAIGGPVTLGRNPLSAVFVPAGPPAAPPSGPNVNCGAFPQPGSDILEPYLLSQFPSFEVRREMHNRNHSQWSRMLMQAQRNNPHAVAAIQQFAELEKQRYKGML